MLCINVLWKSLDDKYRIIHLSCSLHRYTLRNEIRNNEIMKYTIHHS